MTTSDKDGAAELEKLNANLAKIEELTQRLAAALARKRPPNPALEAPGQELYAKALAAYWADAMANPARILEQQIGWWGKSLKHYIEATQTLARGKIAPPPDPGPKDRRFSNPLWDTHPWFNFIKQQYLMNAEAIETAVRGMEHLDPADKKRLEYFSRQIIDMMAPTNFFGTNPDALEKAVATEGESLVRGLENLVRDIEANNGDLLVTLADKNAFRVGQNLGTTEGAVVYRNRLIELIQYRPATAKVRAIPVVIFPPWINKFYILDLKPQNSLIRWLVEQGLTVFVVSWKNVDPSYRDVGMDAYVEEGFLTAIREARAITRQKQVNAVGYCIAGTTLALTLGLLHKRRDRSVNCATFLTTMTDFSDPGEIGVYLDNDFVDGIEQQASRDGILDRFYMSRTFSYLRSNDLIYQPAIRSYMLGEAPPAFDLLYWNGDGTNLPARMAVEYLRGLCQEDRLARGGYRICGQTVTLADVRVPLFAVACETDHIAAWRASLNGVLQMGSEDRTFVLAESGHIAGIVNPPSRDKYGHYTNDVLSDPETWKAGATHHSGSWWPRWGEWLAARSGRWVKAREPGDEAHPPLAPAPGTYVTEVPAAAQPS
ncbi:MAG: class I poly(R)-hydroxyalkanoic acid synthase [Rhodobacteraceae bacterium]|nr:class I poly(R)-hydroxyalkanoic acid synthase [Paracoccaceae bacterium]